MLYRTNSQSRLVEEALRRYNIRYTMVGGFSFYERAEIKDLLCYLRLVRNPHDSMALQRVINTPARGIGKTTLETLERLALETGQSTWDAISAAIANRLIPTRALMALDSFRQLILDAQAMMDPDFAGKLSADVAESAADALTPTSLRRGRTSETFGSGDESAEAVISASAITKIRFRCSTPATSRPSPRSPSALPQDAETGARTKAADLGPGQRIPSQPKNRPGSRPAQKASEEPSEPPATRPRSPS